MKIYITILTILISITTLVAQERTQLLSNGNFKVKCGCELRVNSLFIQMAKQSGSNNIVAAYICAENENTPEIGVVNNINIYDESASYNKINPSNYTYFEKKSLDVYANNLKNAGFSYNYITYKGVAALEYSFDQQGLPTKAIFFLKNKKSYLIQAGTRANLNSKFNLLKYSFELL
jgi:hypothetical protein